MPTEEPSGPSTFYREDLADLAEYEFRIAQLLCVGCTEYHALWGYGRLAGVTNVGFETERDILERLLAHHTPYHGRFLIAGAADAGLLALGARATRERAPSLTVADRCPTPLAVCRRFARSCNFDVNTVEADLAKEPLAAKCDVVLAHNVLMLQSRGARIDFLRNLRQSMPEAGLLILVNREQSGVAAASIASADYASRILDALSARGIVLPEEMTAFRKRLETYAGVRRSWWNAAFRREDVESALAAAGFRIRERIDHERQKTVVIADDGNTTTVTTSIFIASPMSPIQG